MIELLALPHRGIGPLVFGASRDAVAQVLGRPDAVESTSEGLAPGQEEWRFRQLCLSLTFREEDDWKLSGIAASGANCILNRVRFVGKALGELPAACRAAGIHDLRPDGDYGELGSGYYSGRLGLLFWAVGGRVRTLDIFPAYDESGDHIRWPAR